MNGLPSLDQKLRQLKLSRMGATYADWVRHAEEQQLGYAEFLDELVSEEIIGRQERQMQRRYKAAGFPYAATLEHFDFTQRPELKRSVMMRYFDSRFVEQSGALIVIGASGLGKTHRYPPDRL